MVELKSSS